jgi:hypothetical protein
MRIVTRSAAVAMACALASVGLTACGDVEHSDSHRPACVFHVGDAAVAMDSEQAANAATISAVGLRRGVPARGIVVALATARQESRLHNIDYGDRDSKGLFQQRPSQGWGSDEEVMNPQYAADKFYEHLEQVPNWQDMRVTDAAQAVQKSAFPEAYQQWADDSQAMADAFTGDADTALSCENSEDNGGSGHSVAKLSQSLRQDWGEETIYSEKDNDLSVPVDDDRNGWQYASWLVAHARGHGVSAVSYHGHTWIASEGEWSRDKSGNPAVVVAKVS